jgi:uncharacterized RDD family membrane protein YckC
MKCPSCGYVSLDWVAACKGCGVPLTAAAVPSPLARERSPSASQPPSKAAGSQLELGLEPTSPAAALPNQGRRRRRPRPEGRYDGGTALHVEEDLFQGNLPGDQPAPGSAAPAGAWADQGISGSEAAAYQSGPASVIHDEALFAAAGEPVIDRKEKVPECCQAPEAAGLGRRAVALLVDQAILAAILGVFFLGAFLALRISGFDTELFLSSTGLRASLPPFALLAALLSLVYHAFFHGTTGRTPGKALAGVEVRTGDGAVPTGARAILRWLGAALGLACLGLGFVWALFDPSRRGWADRLSGTVIARRQRDPSGGAARR